MSEEVDKHILRYMHLGQRARKGRISPLLLLQQVRGSAEARKRGKYQTDDSVGSQREAGSLLFLFFFFPRVLSVPLGEQAYGIVWTALEKKTKRIVALKKVRDSLRVQRGGETIFLSLFFFSLGVMRRALNAHLLSLLDFRCVPECDRCSAHVSRNHVSARAGRA